MLGRRDVLRGAAVLGAAGTVLIREAPAAVAASTPAIGPQWIAFGPDPTTQMYISWSMGSASGTPLAVIAPKVRWGLDTNYGALSPADSAQTVVLPSPPGTEPPENTVYYRLLLSGLLPATKYHYSVSNDGVKWSADATFTTAPSKPGDFRFTAFGDQAANANTAGQMVSLVSALKPAFHLVAGDLAYSTPQGMKYPDTSGFNPSQWDKYLAMIGPGAAQSIPWLSSVGAHEVEPLGSYGYAGYITRFPHPYDMSSGSPVVFTFTYGNVAFIHLDGNDMSAQETINAGYSGGMQTSWLANLLARYRAVGSGVDFIVVICNCSPYSSNTNHGSDGGLRDVWGPLFDQYAVDLVISGHVHAYERTNPMKASQPTRHVAAAGTVNPATDGTTYICAGGGGNSLYTSWYGTTDSGDAGSTTAPKIWRISNGKSVNVTDSATGYSACRRGVYHCVVVDVTAPTAGNNYQTAMSVQTLMPAQSSSVVTSVASPAVIDSVTLVRSSAVGPSPSPSPTPTSSGPTPSPTDSSASPSPTPTDTSSATPSPTATATATPTPSPTPSPTVTSPTPGPTPTSPGPTCSPPA